MDCHETYTIIHRMRAISKYVHWFKKEIISLSLTLHWFSKLDSPSSSHQNRRRLEDGSWQAESGMQESRYDKEIFSIKHKNHLTISKKKQIEE